VISRRKRLWKADSNAHRNTTNTNPRNTFHSRNSVRHLKEDALTAKEDKPIPRIYRLKDVYSRHSAYYWVVSETESSIPFFGEIFKAMAVAAKR